jgi:hypothetical protein
MYILSTLQLARSLACQRPLLLVEKNSSEEEKKNSRKKNLLIFIRFQFLFSHFLFRFFNGMAV